jgi:hypothetical protein
MAKDDKRKHDAANPGPGAGSSELNQPKRRKSRQAANRGQNSDQPATQD